MEGDQTGQELLEEALRVLDPAVTGLPDRRGAPRPVAGEPPPHQERVRVRGGRGDGPPRLRAEGRDGHARGRGGRRQPQRAAARGDRRQGDHPHRPAAVGRAADRRHPRAHLDRAHGGGRRLQRPRVPGGGRRRRDRLARRAHLPPHVPRRRRVQLPAGAADARDRLRRAQVDGLAGVRGDAEGGARRRRRAPPRRPLPADADRRALRRAGEPRRRGAGGAGPQPRRRLPVGHGAAAVRLDRRRRVAAPGVRRGVPGVGGDGRGAPRHGARRSRARTSRTRWR